MLKDQHYVTLFGSSIHCLVSATISVQFHVPRAFRLPVSSWRGRAQTAEVGELVQHFLYLPFFETTGKGEACSNTPELGDGQWIGPAMADGTALMVCVERIKGCVRRKHLI